MTSGLIERLSRHSRAMIESDYLVEQDRESPLLIAAYEFLAKLCLQIRHKCQSSGSFLVNDGCSVASGETSAESTTCNSEPSTTKAHLISLLSNSEAAGVVGAMYAAVALGGQKSSSSPVPGQMLAAKMLAWKGLKLLRNVAELDLQKLQVIMVYPCFFLRHSFNVVDKIYRSQQIHLGLQL